MVLVPEEEDMLACSALILTSSVAPLLSPGSLHLRNCHNTNKWMTKSNKNREVTVICCTYSKELSKECLEVRVYLCCALYSWSEQRSRFRLNMYLMHINDISSVFQCMVNFNALFFGSSFLSSSQLSAIFLLLFSLYVCLFSEFLTQSHFIYTVT